MDIYYILFIFLFCSIIGWVFETVSVAISTHKMTERGYLFVLDPLPHYFPSLADVPLLKNVPLILGLPMIEIYGFGAVVSIFGFRKLANHPVWLFLTGMAVLTLFELLGSYFCTGVLHKTYWDYSGQFLNFQGRICLMSSLAWDRCAAGRQMPDAPHQPSVSKDHTPPRFQNHHRNPDARRRGLRAVQILVVCGYLILMIDRATYSEELPQRGIAHSYVIKRQLVL